MTQHPFRSRLNSIEFSLKTITLKSARIMGTMGGTGEFDTVLDFTLKHPQVAEQLVTHRMLFEDIDQAFEVASDRRNAMKVLVHF